MKSSTNSPEAVYLPSFLCSISVVRRDLTYAVQPSSIAKEIALLSCSVQSASGSAWPELSGVCLASLPKPKHVQ